MMSDLNLRNYIEECQDVLNRLSNPVLVGLVILQLTQQNIDHEFTLQKPGLTFSFYPVYVEAPNESDGYQIASRYFQEELFKEPQFPTTIIVLVFSFMLFKISFFKSCNVEI